MINKNLSNKVRFYGKIARIAAIVMMISVFTVSCGKKKEQKKEENLRPVKVQTIGENSMSLGYTVSGTIKGIEEVPYTATSSGEIVVINAKNGDSVSAGQVIVAIDNQAARSHVRSATSNVNTASSNINSAAAAAEEARINYEKYKMLYNKRLVTETDYLRAKTNYDSARAQLNASKNSLSSAQAELDSANDTNRKSVIKTNINGVIANMKLELHQQAALGSALFTVVNESEMVLEVGVSPQIVGKIQVGSTAKVKIDELNKEIDGEIYEISGAAQNTTRQFLVKIKMQNPDRELKSGMYGTASIDTGAEEGVVIPKESIVVRGVEQIVYIIKDGKAVAIPIKIVNQNETYASVTGEGLAVGSELVVDGQNVVQDGEKVKRVN